MAAGKLYLVVSARSRRIVGWWKRQSDRDSVLTALNRQTTGQYTAGELTVRNGKEVFSPADLVCPECYHKEFRRMVEDITPYMKR